jgi:hypothetical protein
MADYNGAQPVKKVSSSDYDGAIPLDKTKEQSWSDRHPVITKGLEDAAGTLGVAGVGRGLMEVPYAPAKVVGAALAAEPAINTALGYVGGAGSEAVRKYGKGIPYSDKVADAMELVTPFTAGGAKKLVESGIGYMSKEAEKLAPLARNMGFDIETGMAKEVGKSEPSLNAAKKNRDLANKLVSEKTGYPTDSISQDYVKDVLGDKKLGGEFNKIYTKSNVFSFDPENFKTLTNKLLEEATSGDQTLSPRVRKLAVNLLGGEANFKTLAAAQSFGQNNPAVKQQIVDQIMQQMGNRKITGDVLQKIRSEFSRISASSTNGTEKHAAGEIVHMMDNAVKADNPAIAKKLADLRPKYRAAKTLEKMHEAGEIPEGNVSLEALGKRTSMENNHPYYELGKIGQTFGMKSIGELPKQKGILQTIKNIPHAMVSPATNSRVVQFLQQKLTPSLRNPSAFPYSSTTALGLDAFLNSMENRK